MPLGALLSDRGLSEVVDEFKNKEHESQNQFYYVQYDSSAMIALLELRLLITESRVKISSGQDSRASVEYASTHDFFCGVYLGKTGRHVRAKKRNLAQNMLVHRVVLVD